MRCTKCGYISFDHNQICPKCNKDISDEQAKLNLPTYKISPPSLLGMLTGSGDESSVGFTLDSDEALRDAGVGLDFEDTSMMESDGLEFGDDDQDLEISLNDETGEFELPEIDLDEESGDGADIDLGGEEEELSLDEDEASFEGGDDSDDTSDDLDLDLGDVSMEKGDDDAADSLDGISPDESIVIDGMSDSAFGAKKESMETDSVSMEDTGSIDHSKSTIELNVSDLKINETGELEINSIPDEIVSPDKLPEEDEINIDEIDIESEANIESEVSPDEKINKQSTTGSLDLSDLSLNESGSVSIDEVGGADTAQIKVPNDIKPEDEKSFDLGDLAFEEGPEKSDKDESFDLSDLELNDTGTGIENDDGSGSIDFDAKETGELNASDFEEEKAEETASVETEETLGVDDGMKINLENLDLDLDLDDSEDEK